MITFFVFCGIASFTATIFVVAAGMLSSRISQAQQLTEEYDTPPLSSTRRHVTPSTYPLES